MANQDLQLLANSFDSQLAKNPTYMSNLESNYSQAQNNPSQYQSSPTDNLADNVMLRSLSDSMGSDTKLNDAYTTMVNDSTTKYQPKYVVINHNDYPLNYKGELNLPNADSVNASTQKAVSELLSPQQPQNEQASGYNANSITSSTGTTSVVSASSNVSSSATSLNFIQAQANGALTVPSNVSTFLNSVVTSLVASSGANMTNSLFNSVYNSVYNSQFNSAFNSVFSNHSNGSSSVSSNGSSISSTSSSASSVSSTNVSSSTNQSSTSSSNGLSSASIDARSANDSSSASVSSNAQPTHENRKQLTGKQVPLYANKITVTQGKDKDGKPTFHFKMNAKTRGDIDDGKFGGRNVTKAGNHMQNISRKTLDKILKANGLKPFSNQQLESAAANKTPLVNAKNDITFNANVKSSASSDAAYVDTSSIKASTVPFDYKAAKSLESKHAALVKAARSSKKPKSKTKSNSKGKSTDKTNGSASSKSTMPLAEQDRTGAPADTGDLSF